MRTRLSQVKIKQENGETLNTYVNHVGFYGRENDQLKDVICCLYAHMFKHVSYSFIRDHLSRPNCFTILCLAADPLPIWNAESEDENVAHYIGDQDDIVGDQGRSTDEEDPVLFLDYDQNKSNFHSNAESLDSNTPYMSKKDIFMEHKILGACSYEILEGDIEVFDWTQKETLPSPNLSKEKRTLKIDLITVIDRFQRMGIGSRLLTALRSPDIIQDIHSNITFCDELSTSFFKKNGFTDDTILNSRFARIQGLWTPSITMSYIPLPTPPQSGSIMKKKSFLAGEDYMSKIEEWKDKSIGIYAEQLLLLTKMQEEITYLRNLVESKNREIEILTSQVQNSSQVEDKPPHPISEFHFSLALKLTDDDSFLFQLSKSSEEYMNVLHSIEASNRHNIGKMKIQSIERISSRWQNSRFKASSQQVSPTHRDISLNLFYSCPREKMCDIHSKGIELPTSPSVKNIYGQGIYLSRFASKAHLQNEASGVMVYALVAPGRSQIVFSNNLERTSPDEGFDSLLTPGRPVPSVSPLQPHLPGSNHEEYVLFDATRILPQYLIQYEMIVS